MSQNLISLALTAGQLAAVDQHLAELESLLVGLISLDNGSRRSLARMGEKSEYFCRQPLTVLALNPQIVPPSLGLAEAQDDLVVIDQLRPRLARLQRLTERAEDSEAALGSDVMTTALEGYALLKLAGRQQGLEGPRKELSARFSKSPRRAADPVPG